MAWDSIHFYMSDITSQIVAKSGIPTDTHHLGKILMHSLQEDPDFVLQIDGGTGESETNGSVLKRTVQCAVALKSLGLQKGDVVVLMAPNHLNICIPLYAGLFTGITVASVDETLGVRELQDYFNTILPKLIFCQSQKTDTIQKALIQAGLKAKIITFDECNDYTNFCQFLKTDDGLVQDFQITDFDPEDTTALLISTSGTTGCPKAAILSHKNLSHGLRYLWLCFSKFPSPTRMQLLISPCQWLTTIAFLITTPILKVVRLQTSISLTPDHFAYLVNKYKTEFISVDLLRDLSVIQSTKLPCGVVSLSQTINVPLFIWDSLTEWNAIYYTIMWAGIIISSFLTQPTFVGGSSLVINKMLSVSDKCDFSCFECVMMGGSTVSEDIIDKVKEKIKSNRVFSVYGMTEASGGVLNHEYLPPKGSTGKAIGGLEYRLVNPNTGDDINEANIPGELWLKGPQIFKGYYRSPEKTAVSLTKDGWFKTGDILYRDDHWHFYFVERLKFLLKYMNHQIAPTEVEAVIKSHPGVSEVCVAGIPDSQCGDLVVACVVPKPGHQLTAQEIKDIVKESLADSKQLRGGVIFLKELPLTTTSKINRKLLKEMIETMPKE